MPDVGSLCNDPADTERRRAYTQPSRFSGQQVLQHHFIERQIGYQALKACVLFIELPHLAQLARGELAVLLLPNVKVASLMPTLRHKSATGMPGSTSRKALLICSSLNLDRFITVFLSSYRGTAMDGATLV